jgi:hypothetical protein
MLGKAVALESACNYRRLRERGVTVRKTIDVIIGTWSSHNPIQAGSRRLPGESGLRDVALESEDEGLEEVQSFLIGSMRERIARRHELSRNSPAQWGETSSQSHWKSSLSLERAGADRPQVAPGWLSHRGAEPMGWGASPAPSRHPLGPAGDRGSPRRVGHQRPGIAMAVLPRRRDEGGQT